MAEIKLTTGKVITTREKTGQFHLIEGRLLSCCAPGEGTNVVGAQLISTAISFVCSIATIDGKEVKIPENLADMYEIMAKFDYEEFIEFKMLLRKEENAAIEKMAKKLQSNLGSEAE